MTYIVDANVLSKGTKARPNEQAVRWVLENKSDLVVDPIILGEVQKGILLLPQGRKRSQLETWFASGIATIVCMAWDPTVATFWAKLLVKLQGGGRSMPILDSMIAATALAYDLTVATRNVEDFRQAETRIFNPCA